MCRSSSRRATTRYDQTTLPPLHSTRSTAISPLPSPSLSVSGDDRRITVVLVRASLETIRTRRGYELATADTHKALLNKHRADPALYRPDIAHHALLTLLDSPLNKAGLLRVFVQTERNVLISVHPAIRLPRTFPRFCGLMVQLLHKMRIRSSDGRQQLLRVVKNPVTQHLPVNSVRLTMSHRGVAADMNQLAQTLTSTSVPVVLVVGAHSTGPAEVDWTERTVSISDYQLSAAVALGRILNAFETALAIH